MPKARPLLPAEGMHPPNATHLGQQIVWLFILAIPVSCVAWTITHEEVFREPRDYCKRMSEACRHVVVRKFFYLFTCEYCFSHYIALVFIFLTGFRLLLDDWRGYLLSLFAVVWVANAYMSAFARLRVDIRSERAEAQQKEKAAQQIDCDLQHRFQPGERRSAMPQRNAPAQTEPSPQPRQR